VSFHPDLDTEAEVARGPHVRAIGWLDPAHRFDVGPVPTEFVARLKQFANAASDSTLACGLETCWGVHTCEFCWDFTRANNFGVPDGDLLFVCPEMIAHYVEAHQYRPPPIFIDAVLRCPIPGTKAYETLAGRFVQPSEPSDPERGFYQMLGAERAQLKCRHKGCERGTVELSIFCRRHHFEQIRGYPCPFDD